MHIALGYHYTAHTTGHHFERALRALGHTVTYVGPPTAERAGYGQAVPLPQALGQLQPTPDLYWWIDSGGPYFPAGLETLDLPTAAYLIDVHVGRWRKRLAQFFDAVFVAQKDYAPAYQQAVGHAQVRWLPLAAAEDWHRPLGQPPAYDVAFVGHVQLAHQATPRVRRLRQLADRYRTNDFFQWCPPEQLAGVYSRARVVFNVSLAGDVNMRVFEGTACGALLLTDAVRNGLEELFVPGREIAVYADEGELFERLDYYLAHEAERAAVAEAGCRRAHAEHTYAHRAEQALALLTGAGFRRAAPMRQAGPEARWQARRAVYTHLHMLDALSQGSRAAGRGPLRRAWELLPALLRSLRA